MGFLTVCSTPNIFLRCLPIKLQTKFPHARERATLSLLRRGRRVPSHDCHRPRPVDLPKVRPHCFSQRYCLPLSLPRVHEDYTFPPAPPLAAKLGRLSRNSVASPLHCRQQSLRKLVGLRNHISNARSPSFLQQLRRAVDGEHQHCRLRRHRMNPPGRLQSVHHGHLQV